MRLRRTGSLEISTDPVAFEVFYRRHVEAVTRFMARRVDDPHTVADLVAEVFLAVLDSAHTYRPGLGSEIGWLYGVAHNTLSAERRRAARELRLAGRISGRRLLDADDLSRLEERLDAERPARRAFAAMATLPESERAVLELVVVDQLTVKEAAAALGIRQGTARVRLHRARRSLRHVPGVVPPAVMEGLR
ncbi:sigma-70 family RNA polymerase sigma factor [Streptosporangium sp. NPDC048865]|uniref:RNA polymerase sigma factor n=1 Tax=Streptosporangium sp. NPDC048865 TaxID=3155766 RepID=UPI00341B65FF